MQNKVRNVLIGTPAYDGRVEVAYLHSLIDTIRICASKGINVFPLHICYESLIQKARNDIFKTAYLTNIDDLIFIDADQSWDAEDVLKILNYDVDIVGASVPKKNDIESYNVKSLKFPIPVDLKTNLQIVDSVGTGFMRISKKAIKKIWETNSSYKQDGIENRNVFEVKIVDGDFYSEDVYFCKKWCDMGEKIYVDSSIKICHIGNKVWCGDFSNWLEKIKELKGIS